MLILAAGKATRFKSEHPKLVHRLAGQPLGEYVVRAALAAGPERAYMMIGHAAEEVQQVLGRPEITFIEQKEQLGTGHAVIVARPELETCPSRFLVVLVGDAPLLRPETIKELVSAHAGAKAAATILTTDVENPTGYGRIVRGGHDRVKAIVEEKVTTASEKRIREINSGIICFSLVDLLRHLGELSRENAQREYLLTDMVEIFGRHRKKVMAFRVSDWREVAGVNDRVELARMERILRRRKAESLMRDGVTIIDPEVTSIDEGVKVGADTVIEPGARLLGTTRIGRAATIGAWSTVIDSVLGDRVTVKPYSLVSASELEAEASVGPYGHVRDGAVIESQARIGNFVEVKKSRVGRGTKSLHLTYLGDAMLGEKVNIGAGTVTCNYDGAQKHPTHIEDGAFIGSGTMLVAPVRVGKGSYVAAGSTITDDVPPESLALGRARQVNKEGWVRDRAQAEFQPSPSAPTTQSISPLPSLQSLPPAASPKPPKMEVRRVGSVVILGAAGGLTRGEGESELRKKIRALIEAGSRHFVVNLDAVASIDSAGIGDLLAAVSEVRGRGGVLKLSDVPPRIMAPLEASNLHRVLEIFAHEEDALAAFVAVTGDC